MGKSKLTPEQREALQGLNNSLQDFTQAILDIHNNSADAAEGMKNLQRAFGVEEKNNAATA